MTRAIEDFLVKAAADPVELSIHDLLAIWSYRARSYESVARVERDLSAAGLRCDPGLGRGDLGSTVRVGTSPGTSGETEGDAEVAAEAAEAEADQPLQLPHIAPLIGDIPSAIGGIEWVHPDRTLWYAQGLMVEYGYSQLAVMTGPRELVGAVSWRTIAEARLGNQEITLASATDPDPKVVRTRDKLLEQIETIYAADFVFVRDVDDIVCGIVTTADLSVRFRDLTTPFFQLGEIEYRLRRCIEPKFTVDELRRAARNNRIDSVKDMSFGNYVYLLKDLARWQRMHWGIDQGLFLEQLSAAHEIRNRVAHYDVKPVSLEEVQHLVRCLNYMRSLDRAPWP